LERIEETSGLFGADKRRPAMPLPPIDRALRQACAQHVLALTRKSTSMNSVPVTVHNARGTYRSFALRCRGDRRRRWVQRRSRLIGGSFAPTLRG